MKLQFKHQQFQADAAKAVCDVFQGQPYLTPTYLLDSGINVRGKLPGQDTGWNNQPLVPQLADALLLDNLRKVQLRNGLKPSDKLEKSQSCKLNLTIEMETGVGKTYTYIKTMYELNKAYGWSKFIVIVPSVAIREGVFKTFQITQDHFAEDYGKKIRFFIYNSANLSEINSFAQDSAINVMIINNQAFNARGKDARRIDMRLDSFGSRRPIDVLAKTNPILIIDEPQSVEGKVTREKLQKFNPLLTLRYSATHKSDSIYNMVYRLDAQEAYNRRLVKKIEVKGFRVSGTSANTGYLYLEAVNVSAADPTATLEFDCKGKQAVSRKRRVLKEGDNLFDLSNGLEEYRDGYTISGIDGRDNHIEFTNGLKIFAGQVIGHVDENQLRRLQIRETILSHFDREEQNFAKGIKTLSLFFIDEVAKYRQYDQAGQAQNGIYADMFEEEYANVLADKLGNLPINPAYFEWLKSREAQGSHAGYFSIDKKGGKEKVVDSKVKRGEDSSDDVDAYNLIMKDREKLLDMGQQVRFIFSHSALREGWDNPNVFQICTLKQSASETRKRQEVGRGLRLCVNNQGERMDEAKIGPQADDINLLTVIASDSYEDFTKGLQRELAESVSTRPCKVDTELFEGVTLRNDAGETLLIGEHLATLIHEDMVRRDYVEAGQFTEKYWTDRKNGKLELREEVAPYAATFMAILDSVYDPDALKPEDARKKNVVIQMDDKKRSSDAFKKLWAQINAKSAYTVKFDEQELIAKSIKALDKNLHVQKIYFTVEAGRMDKIASKEDLEKGSAFNQYSGNIQKVSISGSGSIKYDLLGKIVTETGLTRSTVAKILSGISKGVFGQYRENPEDFIIKASNIINNEKAAIIIEHIVYNKIEANYDSDIFTEPGLRGQLGKNAIKTNKHLYDYLIYDSDNEKKFGSDLDKENNEVELYIKLPKKFYISTPMGKYNPDWAIAFHEGNVKHIYFVAETKGSLDSLELRAIENAKIECARKHFQAISSDKVKYDVVNSYQDLMNKVLQ